MVLNYGSSLFARTIMQIISLFKTGMHETLKQLTLLCFICLLINITYDILLAQINGDLKEALTGIVRESIYICFLMFLTLNWLGGINFMENIVEPVFLRKIPYALFHFQTPYGKWIWSGNGALMNLDTVWGALKDIPDMVGVQTSGIAMLLGWVMKSNLGATIAFIFFKLFIYVIVMLIFADILKMIIETHILLIFVPIIFPALTFKFLREQFGNVFLKTYLLTMIQYYFLFVLIGFITGLLLYIESKYSIFIALFFLMSTHQLFKLMIRNLRRLGERM